MYGTLGNIFSNHILYYWENLNAINLIFSYCFRTLTRYYNTRSSNLIVI